MGGSRDRKFALGLHRAMTTCSVMPPLEHKLAVSDPKRLFRDEFDPTSLNHSSMCLSPHFARSMAT